MRRTKYRSPAAAAAFVIASVIAPAPALAQAAEQPRVYVPEILAQPQVTLEEAARLTILNDPLILSERQNVLALEGSWQMAQGAFDHLLNIVPSYRYTRGELIGAGLRREVQRREIHRLSAELFDRLANQLEQQLLSGETRVFPDCEGNQIIIGGRDICTTGVLDQIEARLFDEFLLALIANETDEARKQILERIREDLIDPDREAIRILVEALREGRDRNLQALADLGVLPEIEVRNTFSLDVRYIMPFRNGIVFSPLFFMEGVSDDFANKPDEPRFGGKGVPNLFTGAIGFALDVPLGKGRGVIATAGPLMAAETEYYAGVEQYTHSVSESVRDTVLSYWNTAAAQERVGLLEASLARRDAIREITEALITADELPAIEMARVRARVAEARSILADARETLLQSRLVLARTMGAEVEDLDDAPVAVESVPAAEMITAATEVTAEQLIRAAVENRRDLRSVALLEEASEILSRTARANLRRRLDLSLTAGYSGLYENDAIELYDLYGYGKAFTGGLTGPSALLTLSLDFPFANNVARGRFAQAEAIRRRSEIQHRNLERLIGTNTVELLGELRKAAEEVERRREAVEYYEETINAAVERFRAGELSLIDTLLTEEQLTLARLELLAARQTYAARLAELRHETGSLVVRHETDGYVTFEAVRPGAVALVD